MAVMAVYEAACSAERQADGEDRCAGEVRMSKRFSQLLSPADFVCEPAQLLPPLREAYSTRKALFQMYDEALGNLPADPGFVRTLNADAFNLVGRAGVNPENPRGVSELKGPSAATKGGKKPGSHGGDGGMSRGSMAGMRMSLAGLPPVSTFGGGPDGFSQHDSADGATFSRGGRYGMWSAQPDGGHHISGAPATRGAAMPGPASGDWFASTPLAGATGAGGGRDGRRGGKGRRGQGTDGRPRGRSATLPGLTGRSGGVLPVTMVPNMRITRGGAMNNGVIRKHGAPTRHSAAPPLPPAGRSSQQLLMDGSAGRLLSDTDIGVGNGGGGGALWTSGDVSGVTGSAGVLRPSSHRLTGETSYAGRH